MSDKGTTDIQITQSSITLISKNLTTIRKRFRFKDATDKKLVIKVYVIKLSAYIVVRMMAKFALPPVGMYSDAQWLLRRGIDENFLVRSVQTAHHDVLQNAVRPVQVIRHPVYRHA